MVTKYTLNIGQVKNNGVVCKSPIVEVLSSGDFITACIDKKNGVYELEGILPENKCIDLHVSCGECSDCPAIYVRKCVCSDDSECGECENCVNDFCETRCLGGEYCLDDKCVECDPNNPCSNGAICKDGKCVCPQDKPYSLNGRCVECLGDTIEGCQKCVNNVFEPIVCIGVCDPSTSECVECLQASDCTGVNECCFGKTCGCCEGYERNQNGDCELKPECREDSDCGECQVCRGGNCEPTNCPDGQTCILGHGCVPECDCFDNVPCADVTKRCVSGIGEDCGCIACTGDCASGCGVGCYCDGEKCVEDLCADGSCPCTNGVDCPDGYGCRNGQCVPCTSQSCTDCGNTLGCGCISGNCVDLPGCNSSDCSCVTSGDCPSGSTCYQGTCVSCSNFSCTDCSRPGCSCNGGTCGGIETSCQDTFTLEKNDNCSITTTLVKSQPCACPPLVVDVRGVRVNDTESQVVLQFTAEVRKGVYTSDGSTTSLPLLDNVSHPNILENDTPLTGSVKLTPKVTYRDTVFEDGVVVSRTLRTETLPEQLVTFFGGVASQTFAANTFNKVGTFTVTTPTLTTSIVDFSIDFTIDSIFSFPNECNYLEEKAIGSYKITNNSQLSAFAGTLSNPRGVGITSGDSRLPAFNWFKSANGVYPSGAFRKLYVAPNGSGAYVDTISTFEEGAESCLYYMTSTDCTCKPNPSKYVVFCSPADLDFEVTGCGRKFKIRSFSACSPNQNKVYNVVAGSVLLSFTPTTAPVGVEYISGSVIEEVEFSLECDTQDVCTKVYQVPNQFGDLEVQISGICTGDGTSADVVIPSISVNGLCTVNSVNIQGVEYLPGDTVTVGVGSYPAIVTWQCGCPPTTQIVSITCCDVIIPTITRNCVGSSTCNQLAGAIYKVNGVAQNDICTYVDSRPTSESIQITVEKLGCTDTIINLPSILGSCCGGFDAIVTRISGSVAQIEVFNDDAPLITISDGDPDSTFGENIIQVGVGLYQARDLFAGSTYNIAIESSKGCTTLRKVVLPELTTEECGLDLTLNTLFRGTTAPCTLQANISEDRCPCETGVWEVGVTALENITETTMDVVYTTRHRNFQANTDTSDGVFRELATITDTIFSVNHFTTTNTQTIARQYSVVQECLSGLITYTVSEKQNGLVDVTLRLTGDVVDTAGAIPQITNGGVTEFGPATYRFNGLAPSNQAFLLEVNGLTNSPYQFAFNLNFSTNAPGSVSVNACNTVSTEIPAAVNIRLDRLVLLDGCSYGGVNVTFQLKGDGTITPSGTRSVVLTPQILNNRKTKFTWLNGNTEVFSEYDYVASVLPDEFVVQGDTYSVEASCEPCEEIETRQLCCPVDMTLDVDTCGTQITANVNTPLTGSYTYAISGPDVTIASQVVSYSSEIPTPVVFAGTFTPDAIYSVTLTPSNGNCIEARVIQAPPYCCNIALTAEASLCNDSIVATISGTPGDYSVGGALFVNQTVTIPSNGDAQMVTFNGPYGPNISINLTARSVSETTCSETIVVTTNPRCAAPSFVIATDTQAIAAGAYATYMPTIVVEALFTGVPPLAAGGGTVDLSITPIAITTANIGGDVLPLVAEQAVGFLNGENFTATTLGYAYQTAGPTSLSNVNLMCVTGPSGVGDWSFRYEIDGIDVLVEYNDTTGNITYVRDAIYDLFTSAGVVITYPPVGTCVDN